MFSGITLGVAGSLCAGVAFMASPTSGSSQMPADTRAQFTPVIQEVPSQPRWFKGDDGRFHLEYEIFLTSVVPWVTEVNSISVLDGRGHRIQRLSGDRLKSAMGFPWDSDKPKNALTPFAFKPVWIDLAFRKRRSVPLQVKHRLTITLPDGTPVGPEGKLTYTYTSSRAAVQNQAARVLASPVRGGRWVTVVGAHRRSLQAINGRLRLGQRFAVDYSALLNGRDRTHRGSASRNASYFNYGQPLLAVGDGKVVSVVDRYPDQIPNAAKPVPLGAADGNHVIIRLAKGVYAGYAHVKPGSVRIRPGQTVRKGQVLGKLGNSGNSTGPHLHFQLMDRPSLLDADGLPFTVDRFRFYGRVPSLEEFIDADREGTPVPINRSRAGNRHAQGLTGLDVATFRKAGASHSK